MLDIWALRITGGSFTNPCTPRQGGGEGVDNELAIVAYVEATQGFQSARPVLAWVHIEAKGDPHGFPMRGPGETLLKALLRRGWAKHLGTKDIPAFVYFEFVRELARKLRENPFIPPAPVIHLSASEIGDELNAELAGALGTRRERSN